ncbi:phage tail protein [Xenorhabdus japonica]|uniref:Phage tail fibre repeat-containing protein n=1 Tax=Xenorhabdus japonica TaxID=53341 RepID=A0A1I4ZVN0_9GAMM|nr:phage tail protein [Xenorhabdus japonica]SFN54282.1 Phage tail fibre repeat-containing protein [Xenorhabdus japonica]
MSIQDKKPDVPVPEDGDLVVVSTPKDGYFVVVPTPKYVKKAIEEHSLSRNHPYATQVEPGLVTLSNETGSDSEITVATSKAVKKAYELANTANQNVTNAHMDGSSLPVGVPVPWPTETPPKGWLMCNGDSFDIARYPKLALAYPSGKLPDLRGEFIRGWDGGSGNDAGRALLSSQTDAIQNIVGTFGRTQLFHGAVASGPFQASNWLHSTGLKLSSNTGYGAATWTFDASRAVRTANETRPRNIAFNYIVKAA